MEVGFQVSVPLGTPAGVLPAIVAELTGRGTPGSIGASAGSALAALGVVAAADEGTVQLRAASASPPPSASLAASSTPSASLHPGTSPSLSPTGSTSPPATPSASTSLGGIGEQPAPTPTTLAGGERAGDADIKAQNNSVAAAALGCSLALGVLAVVAVLRKRAASRVMRSTQVAVNHQPWSNTAFHDPPVASVKDDSAAARRTAHLNPSFGAAISVGTHPDA